MGQQLTLEFADATPTKEFFISMLTRDIGLVRAIIDLVDNCIDGANRIRPPDRPLAKGTTKRLDGLWVRLEYDGEHFKISDNCGGIDIVTAEHVAFRLGRPPSSPGSKHSIGQFGVGMKRALFKLGGWFSVESQDATHHFKVEQDVKEWTKTGGWRFPFSVAEERSAEIENTGTAILVKKLHDAVKNEFKLDNFTTRLRNEIQSAHQHSMAHGLAITLNAIPLGSHSHEVLSSESLIPGRDVMEFEANGVPPVKVVILVGVASSSPSDAGWYVYCNGRMIIVADQTNLTGWGEEAEARIPKYHNQFSRFRGFAYFDCDDASRLPWNTTKTGVDEDSPIYRAVRQRMVTMMRPVIDFLNKVDKEKDALDETPLTDLVAEAKAVPVEKLQNTSPRFVTEAGRTATSPPKPKTRRIQYDANIKDIDKVKASLKVDTLREVGERTFSYYLRVECD